MEFLAEQWLPILASAVIVWIASFLMHMVLPLHKGEWRGLPDEASALETIRKAPPGSYMFPWCSMAEMKDPAVQEKIKRGPNGIMVVWSGPTNFGASLVSTLVFYIVVGIFVAYLADHTLPPASEYLARFRICGCAAFLANGLGWIPTVIWFRMPGFWTYLFDGLVYALLTAGTFGWLWQQ